MRSNRPLLHSLATLAAGLLALVACQNATGPAANSNDPVVVTAMFQANPAHTPDSTVWKTSDSSGSQSITCTGTPDVSCTETFQLPHPLGADSLALELWTLGIRTGTIYFTENGRSSTLDWKTTTILRDALDTLLLHKYQALTTAQKASISALGQEASSLVAYYASLILAGDTAFVGKALPVGMSADSIRKDLVYLGISQGKTSAQLASLVSGLDTGSIRTIAATLVQENLLKPSDTLDWFHPVRSGGSAAVSGTLLAGGTPVSVTGSFSWNPGVQVALSRIAVHTAQGVDTSDFQFPTQQFHPAPSDTAWNLAGSLTVQALGSAPAGWDTLVVALSADATHSATLRIPFQVEAKDLTPPALSILSPVHDPATVPNATSTFVVQAMATDSGSGVDSLKIGSKTLRTSASLSDTLLDTLPLVVGNNGFLVQAWDHAGNTSTANFTITRAPAPANTRQPTITRVSPTLDTLSVPWDTKSTVLAWTIAADTALASVTVNGHPLSGRSGLFQDTAALAMGSNLFALAAVDAYGLAAHDTVRILRLADTSRPLVARAPGTSDTVLLQSQTSWSPVWIVSDNALDSVTINGIPATPGSANSFSAKVPLAGDSLWITLVAKDSSGNTSRDSLKVRRLYDKTPPAVRFQGASRTALLPNTQTIDTVAWEVSDDLKLDTVYVNGTVVADQGGGLYQLIENIAVGTHRYYLQAVDSAKNRTYDTVIISRAALAPTHSVASGNYIGTVYDTITLPGGCDSLLYSLDTTHWFKATTPLSLTGTGKRQVYARSFPGGASSILSLTLSQIKEIATGGEGQNSDGYTLFLKTDSTAWGVGNNKYGNLGAASSTVTQPIQLASRTIHVAASRGGSTSFFVSADGMVSAMGVSQEGSLGIGSRGQGPASGTVGLTGIDMVSAAPSFTLFHTTDGTVWTAGDRYWLIGSDQFDSLPVRVDGISEIGSMFAENGDGFFLDSTGGLWASGDNSTGELGTGSTNSVFRVTFLRSGIKSVAGGAYHTLILFPDGSVYSAGMNFWGILGKGTLADADSIFSVVYGVSNVAAVAAGWDLSLFLQADGELFLSGMVTTGYAVGNPLGTDHPTPFPVATDVSRIWCGWDWCFFTKTDGTLWAMGINESGQFGNSSTTSAATPVQVNF